MLIHGQLLTGDVVISSSSVTDRLERKVGGGCYLVYAVLSL